MTMKLIVDLDKLISFESSLSTSSHFLKLEIASSSSEPLYEIPPEAKYIITFHLIYTQTHVELRVRQTT